MKEYEYKFAQLHLHWGDDFRGGSEHTINGRRYFGEVHIVHYEDEYDNLGEALEDAKGDGVAVLGYFIDVRFFKAKLRKTLKILRVVQTQAILFLKSVSERGESVLDLQSILSRSGNSIS